MILWVVTPVNLNHRRSCTIFKSPFLSCTQTRFILPSPCPHPRQTPASSQHTSLKSNEDDAENDRRTDLQTTTDRGRPLYRRGPTCNDHEGSGGVGGGDAENNYVPSIRRSSDLYRTSPALTDRVFSTVIKGRVVW